MSRMIRISPNLVLLGLISILLAGCDIKFTMTDGYSFNFEGETLEESEDGTFAENIETIHIENRFGNIQVVAASEGDAGYRWDAKLWADSKEQAASLMEEVFVDAKTSGARQTLSLVIPEAAPEFNGIKSNFVLRVPAGLKVELVNRHGSVEASDIENELETTNRHGNVSLKNVTGASKIENEHGDLTAVGLADCSIELNHGNADISRVTADLLEFKGSHGKVTAQAIDGELKLSSSHMRVEVSGVTKNAKIEASHNLIVVENIDGDLDVTNSHGRIEATGIRGNLISANAHSKTIIETSGNTVTAKAKHGAVELTVNNTNFQSVEASTSHGNLELALPAETSAAISLKATHGSAESDLESTDDSSSRVTLQSEYGSIRVKAISTSATHE